MISRFQSLKQIPRVAFASRASASTSSSGNSSVPDASSTAVSKSDVFQDTETHTGQTFEKNDYRLARFVGKTKKVVPSSRWAINLVNEIPPTPVADRFVSCNGGGGPLGHPKVFINLDAPGNHACGYCGLRFYQEKSDHHH